MPDFRLHTVGCGSAKPSLKHNPSCTVLDIRNTLYMIDCGEGAQQMMQKMRLRLSRLNHIFITHTHGDHYLGLPGLLGTLALHGREGSLNIYITKEGRQITETINNYFNRELPYQIVWHEINPKQEQVLIDSNALTVKSIPLDHRVPCTGFLFQEKPKLRHIIRDMVDYHQVPVSQLQYIKAGADFVKPDGTVVPNSMLTSDADPSFSYAHIGDTKYMPDIAAKLGQPTLLYHETTYLEDNRDLAEKRYHSTAKEAAMVARDCGAKALLTGHYSSRYTNDSVFAAEASTIFPNSLVNREGLFIDIPTL